MKFLLLQLIAIMEHSRVCFRQILKCFLKPLQIPINLLMEMSHSMLLLKAIRLDGLRCHLMISEYQVELMDGASHQDLFVLSLKICFLVDIASSQIKMFPNASPIYLLIPKSQLQQISIIQIIGMVRLPMSMQMIKWFGKDLLSTTLTLSIFVVENSRKLPSTSLLQQRPFILETPSSSPSKQISQRTPANKVLELIMLESSLNDI